MLISPAVKKDRNLDATVLHPPITLAKDGG
jgi:hypothetical protein